MFLSVRWGFEHHDCKGQLFILERGEYPNRVTYAGSLSYHTESFMSFRPIYCAVNKTLMNEEPKLWILLAGLLIVKHSLQFSQSRHMMIFQEGELHPSLQAVGWFMPEVGSMHLHSGAFVCFECPDYRGQQYITECERHGGDYLHWRNWGSHCQTPKIQSIRH
ncbi:LOW QUALITY PROTEIN: crystallin, beta A1, like 2 [Gambusia affinis]|uniref:LOW QUALITY PROTEIN: crystallin, beta A1, like 2 n=1 Tax=Gambusia affinis TaxID=33528 RepID=UPI001CDCF56B|nr:LOW QUALITY PROTEIN: crystallin, beta A1, like 2 [Gambusia affinis]